MSDLKKGDILNIVKNEYREKNNPSMVLISSPSLDGMDDIVGLRKKEIYSIEHHDFHRDLSKFGVNVGHYTLSGVKIESIAFPPDDEDIIRINGDIDLPTKSTPRKQGILDTFFLDYETAKNIAVQLNEVELEKLEELDSLLKEAKKNMEDVVNNKRV